MTISVSSLYEIASSSSPGSVLLAMTALISNPKSQTRLTLRPGSKTLRNSALRLFKFHGVRANSCQFLKLISSFFPHASSQDCMKETVGFDAQRSA